MKLKADSIINHSYLINKYYHQASSYSSNILLDFVGKFAYLRNDNSAIVKFPIEIEDRIDTEDDHIFCDGKKLLSICKMYESDTYLDLVREDDRFKINKNKDSYTIDVFQDKNFLDISVFEIDENLEGSLLITEQLFNSIKIAKKYLDSNFSIKAITIKDNSLFIVSPENIIYYNNFKGDVKLPDIYLNDSLVDGISNLEIGNSIDIFPNKYIMQFKGVSLVIPKEMELTIPDSLLFDNFKENFMHESSITFNRQKLISSLSSLLEFSNDVENNIVRWEIVENNIIFSVKGRNFNIKKESDSIESYIGEFNFDIAFSNNIMLKVLKDLVTDQVTIHLSGKTIITNKGEEKIAWLCYVEPSKEDRLLDDSFVVKRFTLD